MAKPPPPLILILIPEEYAFEVLARARYGRVPSPGTSMDGAIALNFIIRPYTIISFHAFSPIRAKGRNSKARRVKLYCINFYSTLSIIL